MRILMCNSFYYVRGGAERYCFELTKLLESQGHEVIPFGMHHRENFTSKYSKYFVSFIDYPSLLAQKPSTITKLRVFRRVLYSQEAKQNIEKLLVDTKPDIAHVHGIGHEMSPSILDAIKRFNIPIVQTLHDYGLLCPNSGFFSNGEICEKCKKHQYFNVVLNKCKRGSLSASLVACFEKYFHHFMRIYEKNIDVFISPSLFLQRKFSEYGIENKVINIPNFIDVDSIEPNFDSENYFIFAGRLVDIKGINTLLKAMRYVPTSHLYIAGDGDQKKTLEEYIKRNKILNVSFMGYLATQDLIHLMQEAAFTIFPSECYENYPMTILESFSCGTPIIASNLGAMPDIIKDGWNGLLFEARNDRDLAKKIQYMLDNPSKVREMGQNGRKQVENLNQPSTHYQQILEVYKGLLN